MLLKAKRMDTLKIKVSDYKNKVVVEYLKSKGFECTSSRRSMIKVNNLLKAKGQKVVIECQNEILSRLGTYYTWEAYIKVKIVDIITGKEM